MTLDGSWQIATDICFFLIAASYLLGPGEAKLRATVAIETKQDEQYCQHCG